MAAGVARLLEGDHGYDLVVSTQDWHIDPGGHFRDAPDFVDTWPPHGVAGSPNAELHPALDGVRGKIDVEVRKGHRSAAYSGFEGVTDRGASLTQVLRDSGVTAVDVVGLAYDHCVKATAVDAARVVPSVRVLERLTAAVSPDTATTATEELRAAGVTILS